MSAHASQAFSIASCTDSEDLPELIPDSDILLTCLLILQCGEKCEIWPQFSTLDSFKVHSDDREGTQMISSTMI